MKVQIEWEDEFFIKDGKPYVTVKLVEDGIVLDEYQAALEDVVEHMIDTQTFVVPKKKIVGIKKRKRIWKARLKKKYPNKFNRMATPVLPQNCIKHIWINKKKKEQMVFIEVSKQQWDIHYYETPMEKVGYPRLVFGYRLINGQVRSVQILTIKNKGRIKSDTPLCEFPYANVSGTLVCMGMNNLPEIHELSQLSTLHTLFFTASSSNCYYKSERTTAGFTDLREFYSKMQNNEFPDEWLVPMNNTVGEYFKTIK